MKSAPNQEWRNAKINGRLPPKLIACPGCQLHIYPDVMSCPHCGETMEALERKRLAAFEQAEQALATIQALLADETQE